MQILTVFVGIVLLGKLLPSIHGWNEAICTIMYYPGYTLYVLLHVIKRVFYHRATFGQQTFTVLSYNLNLQGRFHQFKLI